MKTEDLPVPIGKFIIENANGKHTDNGTYYHYSEVCNLLNLYAEQLRICAVVQAEPENLKPNYCDNCGKLLSEEHKFWCNKR